MDLGRSIEWERWPSESTSQGGLAQDQVPSGSVFRQSEEKYRRAFWKTGKALFQFFQRYSGEVSHNDAVFVSMQRMPGDVLPPLVSFLPLPETMKICFTSGCNLMMKSMALSGGRRFPVPSLRKTGDPESQVSMRSRLPQDTICSTRKDIFTVAM